LFFFGQGRLFSVLILFFDPIWPVAIAKNNTDIITSLTILFLGSVVVLGEFFPPDDAFNMPVYVVFLLVLSYGTIK
jgi:hypothetical protein